MAQHVEAFGEVETIVLRLGVLRIDIHQSIIIRIGYVIIPIRAIPCSSGIIRRRRGIRERRRARHHITNSRPPFPAFGVEQREGLPDLPRHIERGGDSGVVFAAEDCGTRPAPGLVDAEGGAEGGCFGHFYGGWLGGGEVCDEGAVVEEGGVVGEIVVVDGDCVEGVGREGGGEPGGVFEEGLGGDLGGFVAEDFDVAESGGVGGAGDGGGGVIGGGEGGAESGEEN